MYLLDSFHQKKHSFRMIHLLGLMTLTAILLSQNKGIGAESNTEDISTVLKWESLPDLPESLGVAGPFAGSHKDALIIAGGANFAKPIWATEKQWTQQIHVLAKEKGSYTWHDGGLLKKPIAYGASVTTKNGIVCMGGNDGSQTFRDVFLLQWDPIGKKTKTIIYPSLPEPCAYGQAALVGTTIYLAGGQKGPDLDSTMNNFWSLDLSHANVPEDFQWETLKTWPGESRAFNLTVTQHNGYDDCIYVISGRREFEGAAQFLKDVWEFTPRTKIWRSRAALPRCVMAGSGIAIGHSHIFVLGGADGSLFFKADDLKDAHPGFPKEALAYHTITDTWTSAGTMPANHVTTTALKWGSRIIIPSGEVRPRVRSPKIWSIAPESTRKGFGSVNYTILIGYLLLMIGIGFYFNRKNKNTDDYFRGGSQIPWWAAGCSIFATMLSSLTFTGLPSKAFAQDWVYAMGNMMIPLVAILAVYIALPLYRKLDVTSAYEYLENRFSRGVRLFGSASFTLFHIFRMSVVMSLTGLALAVATPLTPAESVVLMGALSILYCTLGGIEAVIWTDTIQTIVLMGGALLAIYFMTAGADGGFLGATQMAMDANKFRFLNTHWDMTSTQIALWVIIFGGIGQNVSSYTADQAVVQRYMTTSSSKLAARSIWTNAIMSVVATVLFFGIGTALFAFYRSNPQKLDPTITTDQIFPLFIAMEMPVGVAGLIVAGIFSAAQSTVSTSMNSTATTLVTDFMRPLKICQDEKGYLKAAKRTTFFIGTLGTLLGLVFVNPEIKSLFDTFIKIIGLFMGVLGGLFLLGFLTRKANSTGAMTGAILGTIFMFYLWKYTSVNGYLYTSCGITCLFCIRLSDESFNKQRF